MLHADTSGRFDRAGQTATRSSNLEKSWPGLARSAGIKELDNAPLLDGRIRELQQERNEPNASSSPPSTAPSSSFSMPKPELDPIGGQYLGTASGGTT